MLKIFRITSVLEGLSYLIILSVSLGFISRDYVYALGMMHGMLFFVYLVLSLMVSHKRGWHILVWLLVFLASIVPFAFLFVDAFLRKEAQTMNTIE